MSESFWKARVFAGNNGKHIVLKAYSGYRMAYIEPESNSYIISADVSDDELGNYIIASLSQSRSVSLDCVSQFSSSADENYTHWVNELVAYGEYKNKRALFENMIKCTILDDGGVITVTPSHHEKLEAWSGKGLTSADHVVIQADSTAAAIGKALRLAFTRCTG